MNSRKQENLRTLIVGIGSAHGDDQIGWWVAERLREYASHNQIELQIAKSPVDLLDWIEGVDKLVICDACHGLDQTGEQRRWTWPAPEIFEVSMSGTHNLALPAVLTLAEKLNRLPNEVVVWAIEGSTRQSTSVVSPEVMDSINSLVKRIATDLNAAKPWQAKVCTNNR